jgi:hypothetical protein
MPERPGAKVGENQKNEGSSTANRTKMKMENLKSEYAARRSKGHGSEGQFLLKVRAIFLASAFVSY